MKIEYAFVYILIAKAFVKLLICKINLTQHHKTGAVLQLVSLGKHNFHDKSLPYNVYPRGKVHNTYEWWWRHHVCSL